MRILQFFDYVFYRICRAFISARDGEPAWSGVSVLSVVQTVTILTVIYVLEMITKKSISANVVVYGVIGIPLIFNYLRYIGGNFHSYEALRVKWKMEKKPRSRGWLVGIYVVGTIAIAVSFAIYLGLRHPAHLK